MVQFTLIVILTMYGLFDSIEVCKSRKSGTRENVVCICERKRDKIGHGNATRKRCATIEPFSGVQFKQALVVFM